VAARELSSFEYLDLFFPRSERVEAITVPLVRGGADEVEKGADARRRLAERETTQAAIAVLESVCEPMHGEKTREPRPYPLRDAELALLSSILGATDRASVLVVGKERVGKTGLFRAW